MGKGSRGPGHQRPQAGPQGRGKPGASPTLPPTPQAGPAGAAEAATNARRAGLVPELTVTFGADRQADHDWIVAHATDWTAVAFRGRAVYDRVDCKSLEEARAAAPGLFRDRPVGIYAVVGGRSTHVENYEPKRKIRRMKRSEP